VSRPRPIANRHAEFLVGALLFAAGSYLLWDATEGRGRRMHWLLRPITPF
jgi:hypothetical protein